MPTLPDLNPQTTFSGIAVDPRSLERVVPPTRRADGSVRKELKIRPGFTPQEDATRFKGTRQQAAEKTALPRGHILGWVAPSSETRAAARGGKASTSTSSGGRSLEALAAGEVSFSGVSTKREEMPQSKNAKKHAKKTEKKKEEKQKALEDKIKAAWDDDSDEDFPKPVKKGKAPIIAAGGSQAPASSDAKEEESQTLPTEEIDKELADRAAGLNISS